MSSPKKKQKKSPGLKRSALAKKWTAKEDKALLDNAQENGGKPSYTQVVAKLNGRTVKQVRERWENSLNPSIEHGSWPITVQIKLLQCIANRTFFTGTTMSWKRLQLQFPNRSCNSIKKKARTLLGEKVSKKSERMAMVQAKEWTPEEQTKLLELHETHGDDYEAICVALRTGRARAQVDRRLLESCSCSECLTRLQAVSVHGSNLKVAWTIYKAKSVEASLQRAVGGSEEKVKSTEEGEERNTAMSSQHSSAPPPPNMKVNASPPNLQPSSSSFPGKFLRAMQPPVMFPGKILRASQAESVETQPIEQPSMQSTSFPGKLFRAMQPPPGSFPGKLFRAMQPEPVAQQPNEPGNMQNSSFSGKIFRSVQPPMSFPGKLFRRDGSSEGPQQHSAERPSPQHTAFGGKMPMGVQSEMQGNQGELPNASNTLFRGKVLHKAQPEAAQGQPVDVPNVQQHSSFPGKMFRTMQTAVGKLIPDNIASYGPMHYLPLMTPQMFAQKGQAYAEAQQASAQQQVYCQSPQQMNTQPQGATFPQNPRPESPQTPQTPQSDGAPSPSEMPNSIASSSSGVASSTSVSDSSRNSLKRKRSGKTEEEVEAHEAEEALKRHASGGNNLGAELYQSINTSMGFQTFRNICRNGVRNGFEMVTPSLVLMFRAANVSELVGHDPRFADDFLFPKPEDQNFRPDKPVGTLIRSMTTYQVTYSCPYHKELFGYDVLDKFFFLTCYSRFLAYYMSVKGLPIYFRTGELWMRSLEYKADGSVVITKVKYNPLPGGFNICKYQDVSDKYKHLLDLPPLFA